MNDLPAWLDLPAEVRNRVVQRMAKRYGHEDDSRNDEYREDLRCLSAYRLINAFGLKAAMQKGSHYPAFGPNPKDWKNAYQHCQAILKREANDPLSIERSQFVFTLVQEELARFYSHN